MITLTKEQIAARDGALSLSLQQNYTSIGDYAGTGKTTLIKSLIDTFPGKVAVMAYTGKTSSILRKKGVEKAGTIHSHLYTIKKDEHGRNVIVDGQLQWDVVEELDCDLIVVDEGSMVPGWIFDDLLSFQKQTIFIGDHGQLPPVDPEQFNVMEEPDFTLEEIHRNANEIAYFCKHLREGKFPEDWKSEGKVIIGPFDRTVPDQVICGFNKTKARINHAVRKQLGFTTPFSVGERIMVLQNNKEYGVFNGQQGRILERRKSEIKVNFDDNFAPFIPVDFSTPWKKSRTKVAIDYAYCATCHKMQGDEAETVGVVEQNCDLWDENRWNYTAGSRARSMLYWEPQV